MIDLEYTLQDQSCLLPPGVDGKTVLEKFDFNTERDDLVGILTDFSLKSLSEPLLTSAAIAPVFLDGSIGHKMYRRSLCFLLEIAIKKLYPAITLRIGHSLGDGYAFTADSSELNQEMVTSIEKEMQSLVENNLDIRFSKVTFSKALNIFQNQGQEDVSLLISQKNEREVSCYQCGGWWELGHFPLVPKTGLLKIFALDIFQKGLVLRFPEKSWPLVLGKLQDKPLLSSVFTEYRTWAVILGVPTVARLNILSQTKEIQDIIQVSETLQENKLSHLAERIVENPLIRLVLIAGPSSAGKTTFTKKLAIHLRTVGLLPRIIGLDDYFVPRDETPMGPDGKPDFEALSALDIPLLNTHLTRLLQGETVGIPYFDFKVGHRKKETRPLTLGPKDILLMEGIHGINDQLTPLIPREHKFKIFLSALTQLSLDNRFRVSTTDNRLIRRIIRDFQFRGYSALHTLRMWPYVRRGEDRNIFPFQDSADGVFNSALDYELSVLKNYAIPLLKQVPPSDPQSNHAERLITFLENFTPIMAHYVPAYSILREFIGQSGFEY